MQKTLSSIEEVRYCFSMSFVQCQGHTGQKMADLASILASKIIGPVAAIKSLRFALFFEISTIFCAGFNIPGVNKRSVPEIGRTVRSRYIAVILFV